MLLEYPVPVAAAQQNQTSNTQIDFVILRVSQINRVALQFSNIQNDKVITILLNGVTSITNHLPE